MPRQKQKHKKKNFFSRNTPPGLKFLSEEKYKVYSLFCLMRETVGRPPPHLKQRAANRRRGRSLVKEKDPLIFSATCAHASGCITSRYLLNSLLLVISDRDTHGSVVSKKNKKKFLTNGALCGIMVLMPCEDATIG